MRKEGQRKEERKTYRGMFSEAKAPNLVQVIGGPLVWGGLDKDIQMYRTAYVNHTHAVPHVADANNKGNGDEEKGQKDFNAAAQQVLNRQNKQNNLAAFL